MKRLVSFILAITLSLGLLPFAAFAAVDPQDEEFKSYLQEIGMTVEEFESYLLESYDYTVEEFDSIDEIKEFLGAVLNEENLQQLLSDFELMEEELNQLLLDNDASLEQYVFYDDLYYDLSDWLYTEELTPITDESLQSILDSFQFETIEELEAFLNEYDDSIKNYEYIEDLEYTVAQHYFMKSKDDLINTLDSFGLSLAEANKLGNHVISILENADFGSEKFLTEMESIGKRLIAFPQFESPSDLTAEQIAEFIDIWNDLLNLFDLKVDYFLSKDGQLTPISFDSLIRMDSIKGADLMIKIRSLDGTLLADMLITKEMFGSDFVEETGKNLENTKDAAEEVVKATDQLPTSKAPVKTVTGGKLPNTASDYLQNTMAGLAILLLGTFFFRKVKSNRG